MQREVVDRARIAPAGLVNERDGVVGEQRVVMGFNSLVTADFPRLSPVPILSQCDATKDREVPQKHKNWGPFWSGCDLALTCA